ncbi:Ig-like domain-containing protein [Aequorivita capsosiphonis]|uniref:Ig-like domain-containing protein n=1 Tax=Aequorivita capsosiphonis TaxID=487317 RepID=UPI000426BA7D|nr:Ig-like domain-containing protein [Aequorivita capsosiphonis]
MKKVLLILLISATILGCSKDDNQTPRQEGGPITADDTASTQQDLPVTINVLANDSDGDNTIDPSTLTVEIDAGDGITSVNSSTGEITYSPNLEFTGIDTFIYRVCDNGSPSICNSATVTITVIGDDEPID